MLARRTLVLGAVLMLALSSCSFGEASGLADQAVERFHARYETEDWSTMYTEADTAFRGATSTADWSKLMAAVRRKLGHFRSASRGSVNVIAGTSGTSVTQSFDTTFEQGHATEQFRWSIVAGHAELVAYNISSPILILQ